jgi:uncharacterized iron-regulated protein
MPRVRGLSQRLPAISRLAAGFPVAGVALAVLLGGCAHPFDRRPQAGTPSDATLPSDPWSPRALAMFEGRSGRVLSWADLFEGVAWADVVIVGETHDNLRAHELQRAIVEDAATAFPNVALSLEMLETNEQPIVDAYLAGEIDQATFEERTGSRDWGAKDSWKDFYQPAIDEVKATGGRVIAANAPREYVRKARAEGYAALEALPADERMLFAVPRTMTSGRYRERFDEVMSGDPAVVDALYRSQQTWDATMARSIADALDSGSGKVIHLVGSFHSDWDGGLVDQLRRLKPFARVLTVTVVPEESRVLVERDRDRADAVVYAAKPEAAKEREAEASPSSDASPEAPAEPGEPVSPAGPS